MTIKKLALVKTADYSQHVFNILDCDDEVRASLIRIMRNPHIYRKHVVRAVVNSRGSWLRIFTSMKGQAFDTYIERLRSLNDSRSVEAEEVCLNSYFNHKTGFKYGAWCDTKHDCFFTFSQELGDSFEHFLSHKEVA